MEDTSKSGLVARTSRRDALKNIAALAVAGTAAATLQIPANSAASMLPDCSLIPASPVSPCLTLEQGERCATEIVNKLSEMLRLMEALNNSKGWLSEAAQELFADEKDPCEIDPDFRDAYCHSVAIGLYGKDYVGDTRDYADAASLVSDGFAISQLYTRSALKFKGGPTPATIRDFLHLAAIAAWRFQEGDSQR